MKHAAATAFGVALGLIVATLIIDAMWFHGIWPYAAEGFE